MVNEWMKLYFDVFDHPKTRHISRLLEIPSVHAAGHLLSLWAECSRYAPDGSLAQLDPEEIESMARWNGEAGAFVAAALEVGFFDDDTGLSLHDWQDYTGRLVTDRSAERARSARRRTEDRARRADGEPSTSGRPPVGQRSASGREDKKSEEDKGQELPSEIPKIGISLSSTAGAVDVRDSNWFEFGFDEFYGAYPRHQHKQRALKRWVRMSHADRHAATCIAHVMGELSQRGFGPDSREFVQLPDSFLGQRRWEDWRVAIPVEWGLDVLDPDDSDHARILAMAAAAFAEQDQA